MPAKNAPLCLRLPDDLHLAVIQLAQDSGMSTSEWMRNVLVQTIYGTPPGIEEGYLQGRQAGFSAAIGAIRATIANMPTTVEEAIPMTQLGSPGRTPHNR